eukprot:Tbor_TRINITY_DN2341_c0_g1::TRINITY_DN2341_c0_g1_i1::g.156::m.156/K10419/DYNLRB, DNCL2; dynein light chain roadblock-type
MQAKELERNHAVIKNTLSRIASHRGVLGYMIIHPRDGRLLDVVGFNDDKQMIQKYAFKLHNFLMLTQSVVRTIDHEEDLTFLRMRWGDREVFIAPDSNKEYILLVVQDNIKEQECNEEK